MMKTRKMLFWIAVVLAMTLLACSRSGAILTKEEATRLAEPTPFPTIDPSQQVTAEIEIGAEGLFVGRQFLVNLLDNPDGGVVGGEARGSTAVVLQSVAGADGTIWYQVDTSSGQVGWVKAENVEAKAGDEAATGGSSGQGGLRIGDEFTTTAKSFLINLLDTPGPTGKIMAQIPRDEVVTVVQVTQLEGTFWYQVDTSSGVGWVSEENVLAEEGSE